MMGRFNFHSVSMVILCAICTLCSYAPDAISGVLISQGINWNNFVFEPETNEKTPNYYGYGGRISVGYSVAQIWDLALYGQYAPGRLNAAELLKEDARVYSYGAETAFRIADAVYVGGRGGIAGYGLSHRNLPEEVSGRWEGVGGNVSLGLIMPVSRVNMWQASIDFGQVSVKPVENPSAATRRISTISVTLAFVYNNLQTTRFDDAIYNNLLKNIF